MSGGVKYLLFLLPVLFVPLSASATVQVLMGGSNIPITSASASRFASLFQNQSVTWGNAAASAANGTREIMMAAGAVRNLRVATAYSLGQGSYTATVIKNGIATNLKCTITFPDQACADVSSATTTIAVGDSIELRMVGAGTPNLVIFSSALDFYPTTPNETVLATTLGNDQITANSYNSFYNRNTASLAESTTTMSVLSGVFSKMQVNLTTAPGAGTSISYYLRVNHATTTLTCTVADTAKTCSNLTDSITVSPNRLVGLVTNFLGAITQPGIKGFGLKFVPTIPGTFISMGGSGASNQGSVSLYLAFSGSLATSSQQAAQMVTNRMTITGFDIIQSNTTGTGVRAYTLEVNGAPTSAACSATGTTGPGSFACSWRGNITVNDGDLLDYAEVVTGTVTNASVRVNTIATRIPLAQASINSGFLRIFGGFLRIK